MKISRRRTRWTVAYRDADGDHRTVVLAYSQSNAERVARHFHPGATILSTTRGDYRAEVKRPTGARPNMAAIREAVALHGLTLPVEVVVRSHQSSKRGSHLATPAALRPVRAGSYTLRSTQDTPASAGGWVHRIMVKSWLTAEQMGRTLHHELAHALQFERDVLAKLPEGASVYDALKRTDTLYRDGTAYSRKPWEVEAREHEPLNDDLPLAR